MRVQRYPWVAVAFAAARAILVCWGSYLRGFVRVA